VCSVAEGANARRQMGEIKSSGIVAPGPVHSLQFTSISPQTVVKVLQIFCHQCKTAK